MRLTFDRFRRDRSGNIAMTFGLLLPLLAAAAGFAVDYAGAIEARRSMQARLDASMVRAASLLELDRTAAAEEFFRSSQTWENFSASAQVTEPEVNSLHGVATGHFPAAFGGLFGIPEFDISATSRIKVVVSTAEGEGSDGPAACIILKSETEYNSLRLNSGADIVAPGCEIHVHSDRDPAANFNSGITLDVDRICVKGSGTLNNYGPIDVLETSCTPLEDPFEGEMPAPFFTHCMYNNGNYSGDKVTLWPGVYCGWHNFNSGVDVELRPGIYVIKNGGWNVNGGDWTGDGVSFYFNDTSKIQFNSGVKASLTPPSFGPFEGIMFSEKEGLSRSQFIFNDSRGFEAEGLFYLPSRDVTWNGGSQIVAHKSTMVYNSLLLNQVSWELEPGDKPATVSGSGGDEVVVSYGVVTQQAGGTGPSDEAFSAAPANEPGP